MFNKETEYALRGLVYIKLQNLKDRRARDKWGCQRNRSPSFLHCKNITAPGKSRFSQVD